MSEEPCLSVQALDFQAAQLGRQLAEHFRQGQRTAPDEKLQGPMLWRRSESDAAILVERSEEHTSELQSLMRISYAVFCLKKKKLNTAIRLATYTKSTEQHHN